MPNNLPGVLFQPQVRQGIQRGINFMVGAIRPTLGPQPRFVAMESIDYGSKQPDLIDDGGTIARRIIRLADRDADAGAMYIREMLWRLQEQVGDGTATAAVIFQAVFNQSLRYLAAGGNPIRLQKHLQECMRIVLDEMDKQIEHVNSQEQLAGVARSVCYHTDMAELLSEIFDIVGEYGRVEVRPGRNRNLEREYVEGMYWDWGIHSRTFLDENQGSRIEMENAAVVISDLEIEDPRHLFPAIAMAVEAKAPALLIIANKLSEKVIGFLLSNRDPQKLRVIPAKTPGWDKYEQMAALEDLKVLTGGRPFVQVAGDTLAHIKLGDFGYVRRAWVDYTNFGFTGGKGNPRQLRSHIASLRASLKSTEDIILREKLMSRIGKLLGGSATLWIGGTTQREIDANVALAKRAVAAVRGAMIEGVLPGGGVALLSCKPALQRKLKTSCDEDERAACGVLLRALEEPFRAIVENAGYNPSEAIVQIQQAEPGMGINVNNGQLVSMIHSGVFDAANVQKSAVYAAVASAGLALTVDVIVQHAKPEKAELPDNKLRKQV
jgi:chaperonin GroEL